MQNTRRSIFSLSFIAAAELLAVVAGAVRAAVAADVGADCPLGDGAGRCRRHTRATVPALTALCSLLVITTTRAALLQSGVDVAGGDAISTSDTYYVASARGTTPERIEVNRVLSDRPNPNGGRAVLSGAGAARAGYGTLGAGVSLRAENLHAVRGDGSPDGFSGEASASATDRLDLSGIGTDVRMRFVFNIGGFASAANVNFGRPELILYVPDNSSNGILMHWYGPNVTDGFDAEIAERVVSDWFYLGASSVFRTRDFTIRLLVRASGGPVLGDTSYDGSVIVDYSHTASVGLEFADVPGGVAGIRGESGHTYAVVPEPASGLAVADGAATLLLRRRGRRPQPASGRSPI